MLPDVKQVCKLHDDALNFRVADAIVRFDEISGDAEAGRRFLNQTFFTHGLTTLVREVMRRLSGHGNNAVYRLRTGMGGGKTHSLTVLSYAVRHPTLAPAQDGITPPHNVKLLAFNGRERPPTRIWGQILTQLGATDLIHPDPNEAPDETTWLQAFTRANTPILILLDELPPYFDYANSIPAGDGTLGTRVKAALATLLSAAHRTTNVAIVMSDLSNAYAEGSNLINDALSDFTHEVNRQVVDVTPVDLAGSEVYDIIRKRLFKHLPNERYVDQVVESYAKSLGVAAEAKVIDGATLSIVRGDAETNVDGIRAAYPFHPELKYLLAAFKDNQTFRQARGLLEMISYLLRSVWGNDNPTLLIGPQHFDFSIPEVRQALELAGNVGVTIPRDIFDEDKPATAQRINKKHGDQTGSEIASLLFVASLATVAGTKGLTRAQALGALINPLKDSQTYLQAFSEFEQAAMYIHKDNDYLYFDKRANLNVTIADYGVSAARDTLNAIVWEHLAEMLNSKLKGVTNPTAYGTVTLFNPDTKKPIIDPKYANRTLLVALTAKDHQEIVEQFKASNHQNKFLILSPTSGVRDDELMEKVRFEYACRAALQNEIKETHPQYEELVRRRTENLAPLKLTILKHYNRLTYPIRRPQEPEATLVTDNVNLSNAADPPANVITRELTNKSKFLPDPAETNFHTLYAKTTDRIWIGEKPITLTDLQQQFNSNPAAHWLPTGGLNQFLDAAVSKNKYWLQDNGTYSKTPPKRDPTITLTAAHEPTPTNHKIKLHITTKHAPENATIRYAENAAADATSTRTSDFITTEAALVDVILEHDGSVVARAKWVNPLPIQIGVRDTMEGRRVTISTHPQAKIRYSTDGTQPNGPYGKTYSEPFLIDDHGCVIRVHAEITIDETLTFENTHQESIKEKTQPKTQSPHNHPQPRENPQPPTPQPPTPQAPQNQPTPQPTLHPHKPATIHRPTKYTINTNTYLTHHAQHTQLTGTTLTLTTPTGHITITTDNNTPLPPQLIQQAQQHATQTTLAFTTAKSDQLQHLLNLPLNDPPREHEIEQP